MFTGIIETVGRVERVVRVPGGSRLRVVSPGFGSTLHLGDSVSVDGVCLTVTARGAGWFEAEVGPETARRTTLPVYRKGRRVNLERPLQASGRLGGHFVQGHVDAPGTVEGIGRAGKFLEVTIAHPPGLKGFLVEKGSIAVNGASLTIASVGRSSFSVALVPHTLKGTNLADLRVGDAVNLEVDILAKYVKALMER